jgi:hypothetical protein
MTNTSTNPKPETVCTRFSRINLDPGSVREFIDWLCGMDQITMLNHGKIKRDPVESIWGWNAPRKRVAKLMWQLVHRNNADRFFHQSFSYGAPLRTDQTEKILAPIQARIRWALEGAFERQKEDRQIGQGDWGECWWLPLEQTDYIRKQLRKVTAEIVQQPSEYDDSLRYYLNYLDTTVAKSIDIPCRDEARWYVGVRDSKSYTCFVNVLGDDGKEYPLRHCSRAYLEKDGTGYEWGYGGGGPYNLAESIIVDALDGDFEPCNMQLIVDFRADFIEVNPRDEDVRISRQRVLKWVKQRGLLEAWKERRPAVTQARRDVSKKIKEALERLRHIKQSGGLLAQRFDMVPSTFEAALCLDLVRMLESSDYAMQCARCKLPISHDGSKRGNHQRARARRGQPVYHEECRQEQARTRKKLYWRRKASSKEFRERERRRARFNRTGHPQF